ncbi:predicted protein [Chaetoceros tenuissimus]|uniref:Uncharacterized protein n=1 Tax=Chaetoceros tenuissimus TaxID=426638 RepID=A0AAD3D8K5_9STRA|nr:predicted protein [Chaetoceros tenuissimus]
MVKNIVFVPCKTYSKSSLGINNQSKDAQKLHDKLVKDTAGYQIELVFTSLDAAMMSALSLGQIRKDKLETGRHTSFIIHPNLSVSRKPIDTKYLQQLTEFGSFANSCLNAMDCSRCQSSYNYIPYNLYHGAIALRMIHDELSTRDENTIAIFCSKSLVKRLFPKKKVRYLKPIYYKTECRKLSIPKPQSNRTILKSKQKSRKKWLCRSGSSRNREFHYSSNLDDDTKGDLFECVGEICRCLYDCLLFDCDFRLDCDFGLG